MKYESLGIYRSTIVLVFVIVGIWYLIWRIPTMSPDAPIFSSILYGAEIYGFLTAMLHLMMTWRLTVREPPLCTTGLTVDVFIPTYNESVDLVRKTLLAAKHIDYPHQTWLLDDGNRAEMKVLADRLEVNYLARTENVHAKAGNLNNALAHSTGEFVVIFDADHAPQKNFLDRTLGYFNDSSVAFVQTPQDFFNLDSYQHRIQSKKKSVWTEQSLFFKVIQRGKDYWNAAFFCGSCAVVRRSAIEKIGGFAIETITEDLHSSVKLHKAGFRSIYHSESLAYGIAPTNVAPFIRQRIRWGQGAMQVLKIENLFFDSRLTVIQRLNYIASILTYFDGWQKGIFYISPAIVLIAGIVPIKAGGIDFLIHFLPYYFLSFVVFEEVGRGYGGILYIEQYNFARFVAFLWASLSLLVGRIKFNVTSKDRKRSANSGRLFLPQLIILLLNTGAIPFGIVMAFNSRNLPLDVVGFNAFWATVNCVMAMAMLTFSQKIQRFLRDEYRFPIPLPMVISDGDVKIHGSIDNISVTGCRIYARMPDSSRKGTVLQGNIYLPSGPLPFEARITSEIIGNASGQLFVKAVGCLFVWNNVNHLDNLELFLYGTDLQLKLLNLKESELTPLKWLKSKFTRSGHHPGTEQDEHWATCELISDNVDNNHHSERFGLIHLSSNGSTPRQIMFFQPMPTSLTSIMALIYTRSGQIGMLAKLGSGELLENSAGQIYLYPITECAHPVNIKRFLISSRKQNQ